MSRKKVRTLAMAIFIVGFLLGAALAVAAVWPDVEATLFASLAGSPPLDTLHCPLLMTSTETATVRASFTNQGTHESRFLVRAHISAGFVTLMDEVDTMLSLAPGETRELEWPVTAANAAYGYLVFVRVHAFGGSSVPYRSGSCGILVLGLPGSGTLIAVLTLIAGLLLMGGGIVLWVLSSRVREAGFPGTVYGMIALLIPVLVAVAAGYFGWWVLGIAALAFAVLLVFVVLGHVASTLAK